MRRWSDRILILVFAVAIAVPAALSLALEPDRAALGREKRAPASFPALTGNTDEVRRFPNRFEAWFNDRLPLRDSLLQWHGHWKVNELGVSSSDKVILGRDGWLFLDEEKSEATSRSRKPDEQTRCWLQALRKRRDWLAERGIAYLVVIAPEKHLIYPELLPDARRHPQPASAAERLIDAADDLCLLDLRPALSQAKKARPLYLRTDTHWNDDGAYVAYLEILNQLSRRWPKLHPLGRECFDVVAQEHRGDLLEMLHVPTTPGELTTRLQLRHRQAQRLPDAIPLDPRLQSPQDLPPQAWGRPDSGLPRAVFLHDSFGERLLLPLLAEHFSFLAYVPTASFVPDVIGQFRPQIVIQEIVARKINWHLPVHPRGF